MTEFIIYIINKFICKFKDHDWEYDKFGYRNCKRCGEKEVAMWNRKDPSKSIISWHSMSVKHLKF